MNTPKPGTFKYRLYGDWMISKIVEYTGPLYDIGNLHNSTLEKLYAAIVQDSIHPYSAYQADISQGGTNG